ncbi:MAG: phosphatidylinositol mannoside acyltransferase [Actinomycetota bacterium]|nr:phosphatidylinositol mannoside acyltransferase [Actinomycetota bacterium]
MTGRDRLVGTAMAASWSVVQRLPAAVAKAAFTAGGELLYRRNGAPVIQLAKNLHRVLGPTATPEALAGAVRAGMRSYARYWRETLRMEGMDLETLSRTLVAETAGLEHIERARSAGRGVVLALPHSGNWDIAGLTVCSAFGVMTTVAERLEPASLYRRFVEFRESLGMEVLPLTGGDASVSGQLKQRLRAGGIVCLLADRDLTDSGIPVSFFGQQTRMPAGPAMLAALTGADLCTGELSFTGGTDGAPEGWQQRVAPPIELAGKRLRDKVSAGTQAMADRFQAHVAAHPADWHMLQPFWSADRPAGQRTSISDTAGHR